MIHHLSKSKNSPQKIIIKEIQDEQARIKGFNFYCCLYLFIYLFIFGDRYTVLAQEVNLPDSKAIANYSELKTTNVSQLRDVAPTDWAYQALRSLIEGYKCISGFDDLTYRGSSLLSRAEFGSFIQVSVK